MFWNDGLSKKIALEYDLICIIRKHDISFSHKNTILFFRRKMKDHLSQKIHGNMILSVCSVKILFLFPTNMILPFWHKSKVDLLPKTKLKITFSISLKNMIFILENMISSDRKIKGDKKVYSVQCTYWELVWLM